MSLIIFVPSHPPYEGYVMEHAVASTLLVHPRHSAPQASGDAGGGIAADPIEKLIR